MQCNECGSSNDPGATACSGCGSRLPERRMPPRLDAGYVKLHQAAFDLLRGEVTWDDFSALLAHKRDACQKQMTMLTGMQMDEATQREMSEQIAIGLGGIHRYLEGLDLMGQYADRREVQLLEDGLALVRQAFDMLNVALRKNWEGYYNLRESIDEVLPQLREAVRPPSDG